MYVKTISSKLGVDPNTASKRLHEAFNLGFVSKPEIRKRSFHNTQEYIYLVNCKNPAKRFSQYIKDNAVTYHAVMNGFCNFWITSRERIDVEGDIIAEGLRSDYHLAFAPNHSWRTAIHVMREKIRTFSPESYSPQNIIKSQWDNHIQWDLQHELLYRYFKRNLRRKVTPVMKKYHISGEKTYAWLRNLPEYCTLFIRYFPEGFSAYDPYLFMFETDYEDFIIELFTELPTSPFFYRVDSKLLVFANIDRRLLRITDNQIPDITKLHIPLLIGDLLKREIIKSEAHAMSEYYWVKDL
jgi:hypothetical protein